MTEILSILAFAALFVVFGLMRPADQSGGCHSCSHADAGECGPGGVECPLLKDVFESQPTAEVAR